MSKELLIIIMFVLPCMYHQGNVLSRALYGCELWYNLTNPDIAKMKVGHTSCLKYIL